MKIPLIVLCLPVMLLFSCSGNRTKTETTGKVNYYTDHNCNVCFTAFATRDSVKLYADTSERSPVVAMLSETDSIVVYDPSVALCGPDWIEAWIRQNGQEKKVYLKSGLAKGLHTDLDKDGKAELLLYGYKSYKTEEFFYNPAFLRVYRKGRKTEEYNFNGYSMMNLENLGDKGFKPGISILELSYGLQACDYPNYTHFLYWQDNQLHKILEDMSSGNEYAGLASDFVFPADSNGSPNQLKVYTSLRFNEDAEGREPGDTDLYDTTIYVFNGKGFENIYHTKNIENKK